MEDREATLLVAKVA